MEILLLSGTEVVLVRIISELVTTIARNIEVDEHERLLPLNPRRGDI